MARSLQVLSALFVLAAVAFTGCQQQTVEGYPVSGTVTYQGKPVPRGSIMFSPNSSQGNSGPAVMFDIVDGKFGTSDENQKRHLGGAYRVRINGFDGNAQPDAELPQGKPLFAEYNTSVDLPEGDAPGTDFEVKK